MTKALQKATPNAVAIQGLQKTYDASRYNLLAPRVHVGEMPAGTALAVREVVIDQKSKDEVYRVEGGKLALTKTALNKIASAAGITWIEERRTDDRMHPHYCEYNVVGEVMDFDGTRRRIQGTKCVDLRDDATGDGTPGKDLDAMMRAAASSKRDPSAQIAQQRKFIDSICISKARNRAIADILAIPRAYSPEDLSKPFIVPKLVLDSNNPLAQQAIMASMVGATNALFGSQQQAAPRVIEQRFDEINDAQRLTSDCAGQGGEDLPPCGSPPCSPPIAVEQEQPAQETVLRGLWRRAQDAGLDSAGFRDLCMRATGKSRSADMAARDATRIGEALDALLCGPDMPDWDDNGGDL